MSEEPSSQPSIPDRRSRREQVEARIDLNNHDLMISSINEAQKAMEDANDPETVRQILSNLARLAYFKALVDAAENPGLLDDIVKKPDHV